MPLDPAKIIAIMSARKMSRADLARRTGFPPSNITRLLSGERTDPNLSTAEKVAAALGCSVTRLIKND